MSGKAPGRSSRDYDAYSAALAELGVEPGPGATLDAVRKAYRSRMLDCHPDRFPGDTAKADEAKRVNNAMDLLKIMSEDGRLAQYNVKADRDRRTGGGAAPGPTLASVLVVWLVIGVAGAGKTRGWAMATANRYAPRPALRAVAARHLCQPDHCIARTNCRDLGRRRLHPC